MNRQSQIEQMRPVIAVTMGDPAGIGPEIIVKALATPEIYQWCRPIALGNAQIFRRATQKTRSSLRIREMADIHQATFSKNTLTVLNCTQVGMDDFKPGIPSAKTGRAALEAIQTAVQLINNGSVSAITTAPLSKEALRAAGCPHPGHTELLSELTGYPEVGMLMVAPLPKQFMTHRSRTIATHHPQPLSQLRILLATTHVALKTLPEILTPSRVSTAIRLAEGALQKHFGIPKPKVVVTALNPHAGEGGLFGQEETQIILPAIEEARRTGTDVVGPFPADSLMPRVILGHYDVVVAMYHDQALIPVKLLSFGKAVNLTVGLPFIRTSVDHGTAYDIAWQGKADPGSLIAAIQLAAQLSRKKTGKDIKHPTAKRGIHLRRI